MNKTKSSRWKLFIILGGCIFLILCVCRNEFKQNDTRKWSENCVSLEETVTMLSFTDYTPQKWKEILSMEKDRDLNYADVKNILKNLGAAKYISYEKKADAKLVARSVWNDIYGQLLELLDTDQTVTQGSYLVLEKDKEAGSIVTQQGMLSYDVPEKYLRENQAYACYIYKDCIIGIYKNKNVKAVIPNVYFKGMKGKSIDVLFQQKEYEFSLKDKIDEISDEVCDITWENGKIIAIGRKQNVIQGNLLTVDDEKIEIDGYGKLKRAEVLPVYKTYGTLEEKSMSDIVIGNMNVTYVVAEDEVCAILLNQPADLTNIRVLLLNQDGSVYRSGAYVTGDGAFTVTTGGTTLNVNANTVFDLSGVLTMVGEGFAQISPVDGQELYVTDEAGNRLSYGYEGTFEVRRYDAGYVIINSVSIEKYLYQVVTSEMPASYNLEALKAQAVCARSYAYRQLLQESAYAEFGAHMDDSTNYQVYNGQEHAPIAKTAVDDTCGEVMEQNGEVIEAFYFSTSCGVTGDDTVWNNGTPDDYPYLKSVKVSAEPDYGDLSAEDAFNSYITTQDTSCYDAFAHYFRWNTSFALTSDFNTDTLNQILINRKNTKSENILLYDADGNLTSDMSNFGQLTGVAVKTRAGFGAVLTLKLQYENGNAEVFTEYNIRKVMGYLCGEVALMDGTTVKAGGLLPSAYFCISYDKESGTSKVFGGGYGHGVGMSQNGAQGMAQQGYSYKDILNFFFKDITIQVKG